jgi:hypothetical protein
MEIHRAQTAKGQRSLRQRVVRLGILAGLAAISFAQTVGGEGQQSAQNPLHNSPEIVRAPDSNQVNDINKQQTDKQNFEAANAERKKQINSDSAKLLKLATELKAEVDKTDKDTLSVSVIRRADAIEKLAHDLKEKMKLTVGAS